MTHQDVNDILLEMSGSRRVAEEDIVKTGTKSMIHNEEISSILFEDLIEELELESGLQFNF